jgi:hypothetical protein
LKGEGNLHRGCPRANDFPVLFSSQTLKLFTLISTTHFLATSEEQKNCPKFPAKNSMCYFRVPFAQRYRGNATSFSAASSSRLEAMAGGALARASVFRVGLGVSGATIVSGSCACPSHLWISLVLTSSLSLGISSLFCRVTQCR